MEIFYKIIALLGGLSMFLYGMRVMGDGLKRTSGGTMKSILAKVANNPFVAFLLGTVITCIIQSSTATIVLTVGLVGAGFLTFRQSIGIVLGANVGTAITAQIIRLMDVSSEGSNLIYLFNADNLAPIALTIGIILIMFARKSSAQNVGSIACGLGILFMGLIFMSDAVSDMREGLSSVLLAFQDNYLIGFLAGVGVTGIIQSSSAVVGILQSFASSMGIQFNGVFAVIIGVNIGDCLTTFLVCRIGAKPDQVRTTMVHIIYNVFAAALILVGLGVGRLTGLLSDSIWTMTLHSGGVANIHGLFRLIPAIVLLPLTGVFARIAEKIVPDKHSDMDEDESPEQDFKALLAPHLLQSPGLALAQVFKLVIHSGGLAMHNYEAAVQQIWDYSPARESRIERREDTLDQLTDALNQYVVRITPYVRLNRDNKAQNYHIKAITCFERIGDLAVHISESATSMHQESQVFSEEGTHELKTAMASIQEILTLTTRAYTESDPALARQVEPLEEVIDDLVKYIQDRHVQRMTQQQCDVLGGIQFQNILQMLERISDQCSDLAVYILEQTDEAISGREHQYIHNLHQSDDQEYWAAYHRNYEKYCVAIGVAPEEPRP